MALRKCEVCQGSGIKKIYHACPTCGGSGLLERQVPGWGKALQKCPDCGGTLKYHWTEQVACPKCEGLGWVH